MKYLTLKYVIALSLTAIMAIVSYVFLTNLIKVQEEYAYAINIAGRQRMLSQRLTLQIGSFVQDMKALDEQKSTFNDKAVNDHLQRLVRYKSEIKKTMILFEQSHDILSKKIEGGIIADIPLPPDAKEIYFQAPYYLDEKMNSYLEDAYSIIDAPMITDLEWSLYQEMSLLAQTELLTALDLAVKAYEQASVERVHYIKRVELMVLLSILFVLILEALVIFRPMVKGIRKQIRELKQTNEKLEEANRHKGEFLAIMSHEIRTPLSGIMGMVSLLLDTNISGKPRHFATTIKNSAQSLLNIINDILDISKIEANHLEMEQTPFDTVKILQEVIGALVVKATEKGIDLNYNIARDGHYTVLGDAVRYRQILVNLIENAIKFTDKGYVSVTIEELEKQNVDDALIKVTIKDTGVGIPEHEQEHVFEQFRRVKKSGKQSTHGTGLGLAICKKLISMMGGETGLKSIEGAGSSFWFTVKLPKMYGDNSLLGFELLDKTLEDVKVLLVDPDEMSRTVLYEQLMTEQMIVRQVKDGKATLSAISKAHSEKRPFQCIILDPSVNDIDPTAIAHAISSDDKYVDTVLIAYGEDLNSKAKEKLIKAGFNAVINKPCSCQHLLNVIKEHVGKYVASAHAEEFQKKNTQNEQIFFPSSNILVAEDDITNQEVIKTMLETMKCNVVIAPNGKKAIEEARIRDFDVIFMDINMPVMNGYQAAQMLKMAMEDGDVVKAPIVAMSASLDHKDIERYELSGMGSHLLKPVSKRDYVRILTHFVPDKRVQVIQSHEDEGDVAEENSRHIDFIMMNEMKELLGQAFETFVDNYLQASQEYINSIYVGFKEKDFEVVRSAAHPLKSSSKQIGAKLVSVHAEKIEKAASDGTGENIQDEIEELERNYEQLRKLLESHKTV